MDLPLQLPAGYRARAATPDDAEIVAGVLNAAAIADTGTAATEPDEVRSDWQQPHLELGTDTVIVLPADGPSAGPAAAYAGFWNWPPHVRFFLAVDVHPAHRGKGLGAALLAWGEARAQAALETAPPGMRVHLREFILSSNTAAQELLARRGFQRVRYNLQMAIKLSERPVEPPVPDDIRIRSFVRGQDDENFIRTSEEGFADHWGHIPSPLEDALAQWRVYMDTSPYYDPKLILLAEVDDPGGRNPIVGVCCGMPQPAEGPDHGWVANLTVLRPWRRRGLAYALLLACFGALYDRGINQIALGVDAESLTGATRLYDKVGMYVQRRYENWEKELRPGAELDG